MKRTLLSFILTAALLFSLLHTSSFAVPLDLNYSKYTVLPAVDSSIVLRQRQIEINSDQLSDKNTQIIHINLFDDVAIDTLLEKHRHAPDGSFIWEGKVADHPESTVLFVIRGTKVTGEIAFTKSLFQIRTLYDTIYIAQEINHSVTTKRESRVALSGVTDDVITLTNEERAKYGLYPLAYNYLLKQSAQGHATDMAQNDYFAHTSLDGRSPSERITAVGYIWNYAAENIAAGYPTAAEVVIGWINSPGHHANMISSIACDIGVGDAYNDASTYKQYWVQNFGREKGISTCPAATLEKMPDVVTGTATKIGSTSVQLNGTVNPNSLATTYYFEVGYSTAYGSTSPLLDAGSGSSPLTVQLNPTGLLPLTTYHYRLVAYNSKGTSYGQDVTFKTTDQKLPIGNLFLLLKSGVK